MSLRLRLTLWYSGILALTLIVVSLLVYVVLSLTLANQDTQFLEARANQYTRALVFAGAGRQDLSALFSQQVATFNPDIYAQLVTTDGRPISSTRNLPSDWPIDLNVINDVVRQKKPAQQQFHT